MHFQVSIHFLPTWYVPFNNSELWSVQVLIPTDIECLSFSWNIGPAHIISISTEIYFFLNYGLEQVVQQYDWLEKDLKVRNLWLQYSSLCRLSPYASCSGSLQLIKGGLFKYTMMQPGKTSLCQCQILVERSAGMFWNYLEFWNYLKLLSSISSGVPIFLPWGPISLKTSRVSVGFIHMELLSSPNVVYSQTKQNIAHFSWDKSATNRANSVVKVHWKYTVKM